MTANFRLHQTILIIVGFLAIVAVSGAGLWPAAADKVYAGRSTVPPLHTLYLPFVAGVNQGSRDAAEVSLHSHIRAHKAAVKKGGTLLIDDALLRTVDADDGPVNLTYKVTKAPGSGQLRLSGTPLLNGGTFTQLDINNGRITYRHSGVNSDPDTFTFTVADGGEDGVRPAGGRFTLIIN